MLSKDILKTISNKKRTKKNRMMETAVDNQTLFMARTFRASREDVFEAFASLEAMKKWFGPSGCQILDGKMTFEEGGSYEFDIESDMGRVGLKGTFREISKPEKLVYTWGWTGAAGEFEPAETEVTILLEESGDLTELKLFQRGLSSEESSQNHHHGWAGSFDKMLSQFEQMVPGRVGWTEILTKDVTKAEAFYQKVLGWSAEGMPIEGMDYRFLKNGGAPVAGLMENPNKQAPAHWLSYINVEALSQAVAKVKEAGGEVLVESQEVPGMGTLAVVTDDQGAVFALWQSAQEKCC